MMKIFNIITIVFLIQISLFSNESVEALKLYHENHIVKKYQTWEGWRDKAVLDRIFIAPKNIVEYIELDNKIYGYEGIPKQVPINPDFKKNLLNTIKEFPDQIIEQMRKHLIGIFIISGLGSTGYSEHLYKDGDYEGGFIILDQDVLSKFTANEWASWRINSAFKKADSYKLSIKIEKPYQNTQKQAIGFILLHEIGHIVGLSTQAHPKTDKGDPKKYPFSGISWSSFENSLYDKDFKSRKDIKLYRFDKAKLNIDDSINIFSDFVKTDFCSIYSSNNFFEDFAEAYAIYVHTILMKKHYSLKLFYDEKEIQSFENPYLLKRFQKKRYYFDKLFNPLSK